MDIEITSVKENDKQNTVIEKSGIELRLGDIIEIQSPTNLDYHENTYYIEYIDESRIKLINVSNLKKQMLTLSEDGKLNDESILSIYLLDRDENEGYALQNSLLPHTWVDIHIGGDTPKIITGEITNLEEDMIEITSFPELITFYIDFEYKGILEPFEKFVIREKPSSAPSNLKAAEEGEICEMPFDAKATIEYTETGESIIDIPENAMADESIRETLHSMYLDANDIIFGEELEEIQQLVELPESEKRYGIEIQANDLLDELLSTISNSKRSKSVMNNIHNLIERFKQLRNKFSKFDESNNIVGAIQLGALHKPLIERIRNLDTKLQWLVPVVAQKRKLYMESDEDEMYKDIIPTNLATELSSQENLFDEYYKGASANAHNGSMNKHSQLYSSMDKYINPFVAESTKNDGLVDQQEVLTNIDAIVNNLGNFYSTVSKTEKNTKFMSQTKYVIQRYNLGLKKKELKVMKSGRTVYFNNNMTPNDNMTIKSLIMLPEPVMKFSQIELPGTNILKRVNIHENNKYISLFRLLRKNTDISTHIVDNLDKEIDYEGMEEDESNSFLSNIKEYLLDEEFENEPDKLNKFLNVVIPKTRSIIRLVRKYIKDKLSFVEIVKELEPFMVYSEDITYQQYNEIRYLIKEKISEFNIEYLKKLKEFNALRDIRINVSARMNDIENVLFNQRELLEMFKDGYKLKNVDFDKIANSEVLAKLIKMDQNTLFSDLITVMTMKNLTSPTNLLDAFEPAKLDDMSNLEKIKPKDCVRRYLAKRYTNIKDLKSDNNNDEVYYDKELDDTPYSILDKYATEKKTMSSSTYFEFLTETLISKHNVEPNYANELATNLIAGKKTVKDGEYAVLSLQPTLSPDIDYNNLTEKEKKEIELEAKMREKNGYYYRVKDQWVHDSNIDSESFIDTNTLFCNIREDCYKNKSNNVCEPKKAAQHRLEDLTKSRMVKEFENRITMSLEQLEGVVKKRLTDDFKKIHSETMLREIRMTKYNNYVYELGKMTISSEIITSPHTKLRDLILAQDDFSKKQEDICKFVEMFCREPMIDELKEDMHWLYCKDTNTKLLPNSLYKLATAFFLHSTDEYTRILKELCASHGTLSDDGDSIVDKYSGYTLRKIDFITEDEYTEEGFRITTHSIIEKDLNAKLTEMFSGEDSKKINKTILFENDLNKMIYNITDSICSNIGIPTDSIEDFVIRTTNEIMNKNIQPPELYEENAKKMEKKRGVRPIPYEIYKNRLMFWIIGSCILISIQTAIPSFRVKKTFPGCVRSFSGYPLSGGVEDTTGIEYIACVMFKMTNPSDRNTTKTKTAVEPWNAIDRLKIEDYIKKIRETIENFFIPSRNDIMDMYTSKREYLILHPNEVVPEEHSIDKWRSFLPPVVKFTMGSLIPVSRDFEKDLFEMVRKGHKDQRKYLNIIKTKGIYYGYGIIELINKIVQKRDPVLKTASKEPFLENACCTESFISRPMDYFIKNDNTINNYIQISDNIYELLYEFRQLAKPSLLYHKEITRINYPVISQSISEQDIYAAFIHYCHFDKEIPIPYELLPIVSEKPIGYPIKSSLLDKIEFLKQNGKRYKLEDLQQLMTIIRNDNRITTKPVLKYTHVDRLIDLLQTFDARESDIIDTKFREHLRNVLTSYNPNAMVAEEREELKKMKNYLASANEKMFYSIVRFFDTYGNLSNSQYEQMQDFLLEITDTNLSSRDAMYTMTTFIQNSIYSMTKVFPQMILTGTIFETIPKHWQLSDIHIRNLNKTVSDFWSNIKEFHGDKVLSQLLEEAKNRLNDLFLLVNEFPVYSPIEKNNHVFYSIFDNESINMIYIYFWYSCLYDYVVCANDTALLRTDIEEIKSQYKTEIAKTKNEADQLTGIEEKNEEEFDYGQEIDIRIGNVEELKTRVAKLLITFLDIEQENKSVVLSYSEISKKIRKSKSKEKEKLVKALGGIDNDERAIEKMFIKYKIGRWNVGLQKGLVKYDPKTYDREIMENDMEEYNENGMDADELANTEDIEISNEHDNEGLEIQQFGEDYQDGDFYGDHREDENDFGDW